MSFGFIEHVITGVVPKLPPPMTRLSLNELSKLVQNQSNENDPENLEHRVWRKSRQVMHLAAALQVVLRVQAHATDLETLGYDLEDEELHRTVIDLAHAYEAIVLGDARFGVKADQLIRLRMTPAKLARAEF